MKWSDNTNTHISHRVHRSITSNKTLIRSICMLKSEWVSEWADVHTSCECAKKNVINVRLYFFWGNNLDFHRFEFFCMFAFTIELLGRRTDRLNFPKISRSQYDQSPSISAFYFVASIRLPRGSISTWRKKRKARGSLSLSLFSLN